MSISSETTSHCDKEFGEVLFRFAVEIEGIENRRVADASRSTWLCRAPNSLISFTWRRRVADGGQSNAGQRAPQRSSHAPFGGRKDFLEGYFHRPPALLIGDDKHALERIPTFDQHVARYIRDGAMCLKIGMMQVGQVETGVALSDTLPRRIPNLNSGMAVSLEAGKRRAFWS